VASPTYALELYSAHATNFGPSVRLAEVWDARNLGWAVYDRMPGPAFFTLSQKSAHLPLIVPLMTHVRYWRMTPTLTTLVYVGIVVDYDASGDDVVIQCLDYKALLSLSRSGYRVLYPRKKLGTEIISPEWVLAKTTTANSPLAFVTTGTIEDPVGTDGTTVILTNNQFGLLDQQRLQLFFDITEMGRANTTNHVTFNITRSVTPTFRFIANSGVARDLGLVLGGNVTDYRHLPNWRNYRNDLATIGTTVGGGATEVIAKDDTAAAAKGRRQDVFTVKTLLGIVGAATEVDQQKAVADRMLKSRLALQPTLMLRLLPGTFDPFDGHDICDKLPVEVSNGIDSIATSWRLVGERAVVGEEGERPSVIVEPVAV
jgi:hypothetical protein